jgi:hypothetical protein
MKHHHLVAARRAVAGGDCHAPRVKGCDFPSPC